MIENIKTVVICIISICLGVISLISFIVSFSSWLGATTKIEGHLKKIRESCTKRHHRYELFITYNYYGKTYNIKHHSEFGLHKLCKMYNLTLDKNLNEWCFSPSVDITLYVNKYDATTYEITRKPKVMLWLFTLWFSICFIYLGIFALTH